MKLFSIKNLNLYTITVSCLFLISILSVVIMAAYQQPTAHASAKASNFNAGRIIDDAVFYNNKTMTASQIQTFLNAKVTSCDTNGTLPLPSSFDKTGVPDYNKNGTIQRWEWGKSKYNQTVFTCLKDYKQNTPQAEAASGYCGALSAKTARTAAQIISDISNACGINPQVLLVLLEKEQSLVTDTWPLNLQYTRATGFDCPDNVGGACDPAYAGFFRQVYSAARQFKIYKVDPSGYNYIAGRTNNILWQTNGGNFINTTGSAANRQNGQCGYSRVTIQNQATAALYIYTPYRPNGAALNNHPGTGDACSAYGNRNFWFMFTNWFGSTQEQYQYKSEDLVGPSGVIKNSSITVGAAADAVSIGDRVYNFYTDTTGKTLRMTLWDGTRWSDTIVDGKGSSIRGAISTDLNITDITSFSYNGKLQVYYRDSTSKSLRHIFPSGNSIAVETLDGTINSVLGRKRNVGGEVTGMTHGANGIQLFYYNVDNKSLEHTWWDSKKSRWNTETLDGTTTSVLKKSTDRGSVVSSITYGKDIQLFYHDITTGELVHSWWSNSQSRWNTEVMDGDYSTVLGNYINAGKKIETTVLQGKLFVTYYDDASIFSDGRKSSWRLAYWSGSMWIQHTIEGGGDGLSNPDTSVPLADIGIATLKDSSVQLFYKGFNNQLRHSWMSK